MKKLLKVIMKFEDETQYLEGEVAEKWLKELNEKCVMEAVHGKPFSGYDWTIVKNNKYF